MRIKLLLFAALLISCNAVKENKANQTSSRDSEKVGKSPSSYSSRIHLDKISFDTLISNTHILYSSHDLDDSIACKTYDDKGRSSVDVYSDRSISLKIEKDGKPIFEKEIGKIDFKSIVPLKELPNYLISSFSFERIEGTGYLFSLLICKPDTDICYPIELLISNDGVMHSKELEVNDEDNE
ncbi:DUF4738 domain-containing protein [uncultured Acetobacteroides sp.]|uniref:DUF4738 domain-containing protein n=1 Tax=uncultured Acetobacteroides sp. TaxID=1760811 RepID=UPI0029F4974C|nr:DUF4738 domain-containing protein [uncultured Acetobacteroides sp.]